MLSGPQQKKPVKKDGGGYLSAVLTTILLRYLKRQGAPGQAAIDEADIWDLYPQDDARTAPYRMYRGLRDAGEKHLGDPLVNIHAVKDSPPSDWGMGFYAVVSQPTMVEVVDVTRDLITTSSSMMDLVLARRDDGAVLRVQFTSQEPFDDVERLSELMLAVVLCALERALRRARLPVEVRFKHAPRGGQDLYERAMGAAVIFNAPHSEVFIPASVVNAPTVRPDRNLSGLMSEQIHNRFHVPISTEAIDRSVLAHLERAREPEQWKLKDVASKLGVSPRTLQNKLARQGKVFKSLVDDVRKEKAELLLRSPKPLLEVAWQLGFSEASGFNRSFRRWYGMSPGQWRGDMAASN